MRKRQRPKKTLNETSAKSVVRAWRAGMKTKWRKLAGGRRCERGESRPPRCKSRTLPALRRRSWALQRRFSCCAGCRALAVTPRARRSIVRFVMGDKEMQITAQPHPERTPIQAHMNPKKRFVQVEAKSIEESDSSLKPTHEEIAVVAHQIYEEEGCPDGFAEGHWEAAERSLNRDAFTAFEDQAGIRG